MSLEPEPTQKSDDKSIIKPPPKKTPTVSKDPVVPPASSPLPVAVRKPSKGEISKEADDEKRMKIRKPNDASDDPFKNPNEQLPIDDSFGHILRDAKGNPLVAVINGQRHEQKAALRKAAMAKVSRQEQAPQPSPVPSEPKIAQAPNAASQAPAQAAQPNVGQPQFLLFYDPNTKKYYTVLQQPANQFPIGAQSFQPRPISGMNAPNMHQGRFVPQPGQSITYQQTPMTNQANQQPGRYPSAHALPQQNYPTSQAYPQPYAQQQQNVYPQSASNYPAAQRKKSTHAVPNFSAVVFSKKKAGTKKRSGEDKGIAKSTKQGTDSGRSKQSAKQGSKQSARKKKGDVSDKQSKKHK